MTKSSPGDRTATKLKGEPTQMDFEIPRSACLPGLGILVCRGVACSWAEKGGGGGVGSAHQPECEFLPSFLGFSHRSSAQCPGADEKL